MRTQLQPAKKLGWRRVESLLTCHGFELDGHPLSENDNARVSHAYVLLALCIKDNAIKFGAERSCSDKLLARWLAGIATVDVNTFVEALKQLLALLREYHPHNGECGVRSFKELCGDLGIPLKTSYFDGFKPLLYRYLSSYDIELYRALNDILQLITRLTLQDIDWIEDDNVQAYIDFEQTIHTQTYPEDLVGELRREMTEMLSGFRLDPETLHPSHGSGATAEVPRGHGVALKYANCTYDVGTYMFAVQSGFIHPLVGSGISKAAASKVSLVPKGINKRRVISPEVTLRQYFQKGVFAQLDSYFQKHPELRINLHKQELNRSLCEAASAGLAFGTIDLSAASDSVTWTLVKEIFRDTNLYRWLIMLRTKEVTLNDQLIPIEKAFPMGSALCFPIECLVFACVVRVAQQHVGLGSYYRVYGDDMICHRSVADEVCRLLTLLHFKVNMDKSFLPGSVFTESCGVESLDGQDVTPLRISRKYDNLHLDSRKTTNLFALVDLANKCYTKNYMCMHSYLLEYIFTTNCGRKVCYTSDPDAAGLYSHSSNTHLKQRWNVDLQRMEQLCICQNATQANCNDDVRYQLMLEEYSKTNRCTLLFPEDRIEVYGGKVTSRSVDRWKPTDQITANELYAKLLLRNMFDGKALIRDSHLAIGRSAGTFSLN